LALCEIPDRPAQTAKSTAKSQRTRAAILKAAQELFAGSTGSLTILLRASATNEGAASAIHAVFVGQIAPMLAQVVPPAEFAQRSQILGLALSRYVLKVPRWSPRTGCRSSIWSARRCSAISRASSDAASVGIYG
jgi:hypothetical protein